MSALLNVICAPASREMRERRTGNKGGMENSGEELKKKKKKKRWPRGVDTITSECQNAHGLIPVK